MKLHAILISALVVGALAAPETWAAKKTPRKPAKSTPPGSVRSLAPRDTARVSTPVQPVRPEGRTTIAPFPVPGDTGRDAAERRKLLNVPKPGITTLVPATQTTGTASIVPAAPTPGITPAADTSALPKFGDYVYVEELPEAITRVPPSYPAAARDAGVQGTVMVQALVAQDGSVADTRIVKSIPGLDDAAAAAVRQWRFKPAMTRGQPIAVWIGIPVKFALH